MKRQLHRKVSADQFVRVPNKTVRESKLTPEALGVLVYLLSHSETFDHWRNKVMTDFGIGIRKYSRIMTELEKAGFILRKKGGPTGGATLHITDTQDGLTDVCKTRTSRNVDIDKMYTHKNTKSLRDKNTKKTGSAKNADGRSKPKSKPESIPWDNGKLLTMSRELGLDITGLSTSAVRDKIKTSLQG